METRGQALEWAIALAKAPAERVLLRQRPLPQDIHQLLQVAATASAASLCEVAASFGEDPENLQEAARFYVREVLFYQGADAYRVLGVSHDADHVTLRKHHRLLQQWLHPDRQTSDWDAIFAARVNAAWSQLRTDKSRQAYDLANPRRDASSPQVARAAVWQTGEGVAGFQDDGRWRRRMPSFALFGICAVLGVLALRDLQSKPEVLLIGDASSRGEDLQARVKSHGDIVGNPATRAAPAVVTVTLRIPVDRKPPPGREAGTRSAAVSASTSGPMPTTKLPEPLFDMAGDAAVEPGASVARNEVRVAYMPARTGGEVAAVPSVGAPVTNTSTTAVKAARPVKPAAHVLAAPVVQKLATRNERAQLAGAQNLQTGPTKVENSKAVLAASVTGERVIRAQQVGGRLLAFMTTNELAPPPIWGSLTAQRGALELRTELQAKGMPDFTSPNWRIGENVAAMHADLRYPDGRAGRLTADFVWRERWLVTGLSLERDL